MLAAARKDNIKSMCYAYDPLLSETTMHPSVLVTVFTCSNFTPLSLEHAGYNRDIWEKYT